jgi:hypothetical protein
MESTVEILLRGGRLIEGLQSLVDRYVEERSGTRAGDAIDTLADRLRERIQLEEEKLFPAIERLVGDKDFALTARMRRQHLVLLDLVTGIQESLNTGAYDAAAGDLRELKAALRTHMDEERRVLMPILGAHHPGNA